jgi:hypothetical protein
MKLERIPHNPGKLLEFYEEGLNNLGALCERTWHDRLEVVAEGRAAKLWHPAGSLHEVELQFAPADTSSARDAAREVFPGCPLTFRLAESLRVSPLQLERFVLPDASLARRLETVVLEKLWRAQFPDTSRWQVVTPPQEEFHFALLALVRCEVQAIEQQWTLHRIAVSLTDGEPDEALARDIGFHHASAEAMRVIPWPLPDPTQWQPLLNRAIQRELQGELQIVRARQENSLRREMERIHAFFEGYERELLERASRSSIQSSKIKAAERLAAAKSEHQRRCADQTVRHEIRVLPHIDSLLLVAEKAWRVRLQVGSSRGLRAVEALFVPQSRLWRLFAFQT